MAETVHALETGHLVVDSGITGAVLLPLIDVPASKAAPRCIALSEPKKGVNVETPYGVNIDQGACSR
jgi:hypothetical protein